MDRLGWKGLHVLVAGFCLSMTATSLMASENILQGKVAGIQGDKIKITYEGNYAPNVADPAEIGFKLGEDFIPVEGEWKIVEVSPEFALAKAEGSRVGTPAIDYLVIIHSKNPILRANLTKENILKTTDKISNAVPDGKTESPGGIAEVKTPVPEEPKTETVEEILASFTRTAVNKDFSAPGSYVSCESGKIRTGTESVEMTASGGEKNDFCVFKISSEPLDNFYAAVNITVNTASHYDFMAGIIYGAVIEGRIKPDSIIAVASQMSNKVSGGGLFKSRTSLLAWVGAYRRSNQGKGHKMIVEKFLPDIQSNPTPGILEFVKTAKKSRIYWNGQEMGSWEELLISGGDMFLAFTPVVKGKTSVSFRDIQLYRLH